MDLDKSYKLCHNNKVIIHAKNPIYNSKDTFVNRKNIMYEHSYSHIYETIPPKSIPSINGKFCFFEKNSRNEVEQTLLQQYLTDQNSYWLIRKKTENLFVISIIDSKGINFNHLLISKYNEKQIIEPYFTINNKIPLRICTKIEDVVLVLMKCPISSFQINKNKTPILNGIQIKFDIDDN